MISNFGLLVPLDNENRWTDLLAVLVSADPTAAAELLALGDVAGREVTVSREVRAGVGERVDLQIRVDGRLQTVLEAKVLSGLSHAQLDRYTAAYPDAGAYLLAYPAGLVIDPGSGSPWRGVTWERLLAAFADSRDPWVASTAIAWREHLHSALPRVDGATRWNDLQPGDPVPLVMRARMSWVYTRLRPAAPVVADLMASGGSKGWVARLQTPAPVPGYVIAAEVEDTSARSWPARLQPGDPNPVKGPRVWIGLRQHDVTGSQGFDWDYLAALWAVMRTSRGDWMTTRPGLPAEHDRAAWKRIGAPPGLGYGFGHREAVQRGVCMFGARFSLPPDTAVGDVVAELDKVAELLLCLVRHEPPSI